MNAYRKMKDRQQEEVNQFPFGFAFSNEQFDDMMKKWDLCHGSDGKPTDEDCSKIISIGCGGFIRKSDREAMTQMADRHLKELEDAIASDKDGTGFVYQMFLDEMANHEYGYTWDPTDVLGSCGLSMKEVLETPKLIAGWKLAEEEIRSDCY